MDSSNKEEDYKLPRIDNKRVPLYDYSLSPYLQRPEIKQKNSKGSGISPIGGGPHYISNPTKDYSLPKRQLKSYSPVRIPRGLEEGDEEIFQPSLIKGRGTNSYITLIENISYYI